MIREPRLPRKAWAGIARRTAIHTILAVLASVAVSYVLLASFSQGLGQVGLIAAIAAPMVLGGPMVFYMSLRHAQLQLAYEKLEAAAARDSLTNCFNHGAFVDAVSAVLDDQAASGGALLVVDADHFKSINDRFGHAIGDTALKLIVSAIRSSVRASDIIGRLGGEEFGVFLPGADTERAERTAQAIRRAVQMIELDAGEQSCTLSVSVGGAVTDQATPFGELFRSADERLYRVKEAGRNNVEVAIMPARSAKSAAPVTKAEPEMFYRGQKVRLGA